MAQHIAYLFQWNSRTEQADRSCVAKSMGSAPSRSHDASSIQSSSNKAVEATSSQERSIWSMISNEDLTKRGLRSGFLQILENRCFRQSGLAPFDHLIWPHPVDG
jgi:hypothetical protein